MSKHAEQAKQHANGAVGLFVVALAGVGIATWQSITGHEVVGGVVYLVAVILFVRMVTAIRQWRQAAKLHQAHAEVAAVLTALVDKRHGEHAQRRV